MNTILKLFTALVLAPLGFLSADSCKPDPCCLADNNVYLTLPDTVFNGYYRALLLQPTSSSLCYAVEIDAISPESPSWKVHDVHTQCNYASELGLGFIFCERNAKLKVNWLHLTSQDKNSIKDIAPDVVGPFFDVDPTDTPFTNARGRAKFTFDSACINYGVLVTFGSYLHTHLYGGVAGIKLRQDLSTTFFNDDQTIVRKIKTPSRFWGVGPQLGMECCYTICGGFQVVGEGAASLLVGGLTNHTKYQAFSPDLVTAPNLQSISTPQRTGVVPAFEGRLGLNYSWMVRGCYNVNIEGGYKACLYMNAVQSVDIASEVAAAPSTGVYANTFKRTVGNFALAGPYLSINVRY